ncbi:alpha/beta hydrolase family esterase [Chitinophaga agri]|uniref:Prolyl oligopeptidase family serine peptidase n=1 Tax=Chitinophaga agri TaxID=2703787 RepID=A0A6B9ZJP2_9BACT|nr:prolyl oligopeptidase family serine peptidase [Chitinophaga agri]QHS62226.1 prolyl oligopeptidase family serine peptidase [Chitinophaga agri]
MKHKKMLTGIIVFIIVLMTGMFLYLYRWNVLHPLKSATLKIESRERTFLYHLPKKITAHPRLIILYHGSGINGNIMQIFTGHEFDELSDKEQHTIIAYPNGFKNNWNGCRKVAPYPAGQMNINDIEFTKQIIRYFKENYHIDTSEVFAVGYSNGGEMVMSLARQYPQWFKGFAVIDANLGTPSNDKCENAIRPVSLFYISGQQDPIVPYKGGEIFLNGKSFGEVRSSKETLQYWLQQDKFDIQSTIAITQNATLSNYATAAGKQISFLDISDGGHTIPNRNFRIPISKMGNMTKGVDAPALIWDFFKGLNQE